MKLNRLVLHEKAMECRLTVFNWNKAGPHIGNSS